MKALALPACLLAGLAGCSLTDPGFAGTTPARVVIGPDLFEVRQRGDRALALRLNPAPPQRYAVAMTRAVLAIEQATGCLVRQAGGDPSAARARLDCGPGGPPAQPLSFECDAFEVVDGLFDLRCDPVL